MSLDISSIQKATSQLTKSLEYLKNSELQQDHDLREQFRAAVVQAFEFTFELCWKFMKRYLETEAGNTLVDSYSKKELFRVATEQGLIQNSQSWFLYLKARNETVHTYDESNAEEVCAVAKKFLPDAQALLAQLQKRMSDD